MAYDGQEALDRFAEGGIDLILLDVMLPKVNGNEVCQQIRGEHKTCPSSCSPPQGRGHGQDSLGVLSTARGRLV